MNEMSKRLLAEFVNNDIIDQQDRLLLENLTTTQFCFSSC